MVTTEHETAQETNGHVEHGYPRKAFDLKPHPIDDVRTLKVTVIGAGLAGILAGILLPIKVPGIDLTILEKNADVVSLVKSALI